MTTFRSQHPRLQLLGATAQGIRSTALSARSTALSTRFAALRHGLVALRPALALALITLLAGRPMFAAVAVGENGSAANAAAAALPSAPQPALVLPHFALPPSPADTGIVGPLTITILEGEGALNNIRQRTAREPIIQVEDKNHKRVNGAYVTFTVQPSVVGAGATFVGGVTTLTVVTDSLGQATASGLTPNGISGSFTITAVVTSGVIVGTVVISQTNILGTIVGSSAGTGSLFHIPHILIYTIIGTVVVGGTIAGVVIANQNSGTNITTGPGNVNQP